MYNRYETIDWLHNKSKTIQNDNPCALASEKIFA